VKSGQKSRKGKIHTLNEGEPERVKGFYQNGLPNHYGKSRGRDESAKPKKKKGKKGLAASRKEMTGSFISVKITLCKGTGTPK